MQDLAVIIKQNDYKLLRSIPIEQISPNCIFSLSPDDQSNQNQIFSLSIPTVNISLLHIAAFYESTECYVYLHETAGFPLDIQEVSGFVPLHYAFYSNSLEIICYTFFKLTPQQINDIFANDYKSNQSSFLELALQTSNELLQILLEKGYSAELIMSKSRANEIGTLTMLSGDLASVEWLLNNSSNESINQSSLLMNAIQYGFDNLIPFLIQNKPSSVYFFTIDNECPLSIACNCESVNTVQQICNVLVDIDLPRGSKGKCAVHWLCQSKSPEIAQIILSKGIDTNRLDDKGRIGPYYLVDIASEEDSIEIIDLLLKHGYNIDRHGPKTSTVLGCFLNGMIKYYKLIDFLISKHASLDEKMGNFTIRDFMIKKAKYDSSMKAIVDKWAIT